MPKKILIVDDVMFNRLILKEMLHKDYVILEAAGGEEALQILDRGHDSISAVLLDISMPGIDGFEVLNRIRSNNRFSQMPVIMITSSEDAETRIHSLALGANDFVTKPYSSEILRHCLGNNIAFREAMATVSALQRDKLTGLFSRESFFEKVHELVSAQEPGYYVMACYDIDRFKVVNDQYGTQKGDEVLRHIADVFREGFEPHGGVCCRVSGDHFAVLYPASFQHSRQLETIREKSSHVSGLITPVIFSIGRYFITDVSMLPAAMYDRAMLAVASIKGRYDAKIALYDDAMRERLLHEQEIVLEMETALEAGQFEVWFQPQYNHTTNARIGAEALVRWRHPTKGMLPPSVFIPIFETNGFIYALDKFVWASACRYLRKWMDEGRSPLPVSVNISRYDVMRPDVIEVLCGLVRQYDLPMDLLRLEITESAFTESSRHVVEVVRELLRYGFTVEIDDFGSGYSSLNTLKDVPAQILKLDMKFLESGDDSQRGGSIVQSIVRMAKWLGMSVIAEGVETLEQADYLRSIGCHYLQGYLYARPMSAQAYEEHCAGREKEERLLALETVENLDNNAFWDPQSMDTLIFNSYVGAACIYEYHNGGIELLRATEKYAQVIGSAGMTVEDALKLNWAEHLDEESRRRVIAALNESVATKKEVTGEYVFLNLPNCPAETYLRSTMRVIASAGERYLVYCTNENITAQRKSEARERLTAKQLSAIMENISGGVTATVVEGNALRRLFVNDTYYRQLGYTKEQYESRFGETLQSTLPDDREHVMAKARELSRTRKPGMVEFRVRRADGSIRWLRSNISIMDYPGESEPVQLSVTTDITEQREAEQKVQRVSEQMQAILDHVDLGIIAAVVSGGTARYLFANDRYYAMLGYTKDQFGAEIRSPYQTVAAADRRMVMEETSRINTTGESTELVYKAMTRDGRERLFRASIAMGRLTGLDDPVQFTILRDITKTVAQQNQLQLVNDSVPGGIATYCRKGNTLRIVYCNDGFCKLFGGTHEGFEARGDLDPIPWVFEEDRAELLKQIDALVTDNAPMDVLFRIHVLGGGFKWINEKAIATERRADGVRFNALLLDVTERQIVNEQLRISEEENTLAVRHGGSIVCRYDVAEKSLTLSPEIAKAYSIPPKIANVPYEPVRLGLIAPESADAYIEFFEAILRGGKAGAALYQQRYFGDWRWMEAKSSTIFTDAGKPIKAVISLFDVTERLEKEAIYQKWQHSLRNRAEDSYTFLRCNLNRDATYEAKEGTLLSFPADGGGFSLQAKTYAAQRVHGEDREAYVAFVNADAMLAGYYRARRSDVLEYRECLAEGDACRWIRLSVDLVESSHSTDVEAYLLYEDVDAAKREELRTKERSETDPLTGVLNRATFAANVDEILRASNAEARHALMMLDIDGFKRVNDVFGHRAGDQALIALAQGLRSAVSRGDLVARLGGDEFVVFLKNLTDDAQALSKAAQICALARKSYSLEVRISVSVGLAFAPRDGASFEELYQKADRALYYVKGSGKDDYAAYRDHMAHEHLSPEPDTLDATGTKVAEKKRRMLIVDDSSMDHAMLANIFCDEFLIETAQDGQTALIRLRHYGSAISAVLLDLMMPGMDGFAVLEKMRQSDDLRSIPVIIVSGDESRETCLKAIRKGATDFIMKPVDVSLLRLRVHSAVSKAENERLRAENSLLEAHNEERLRYETGLEGTGITFVELNRRTGSFRYTPSVPKYLLGVYDDRAFWQILLRDGAADERTVQAMQQLVQRLFEDGAQASASMIARLKTPQKTMHCFRVTARRLQNEPSFADRVIIALNDLDYEV